MFHAIIRRRCEPRHIRDFYLAVTSPTRRSYVILPLSIRPGNRPEKGAPLREESIAARLLSFAVILSIAIASSSSTAEEDEDLSPV